MVPEDEVGAEFTQTSDDLVAEAKLVDSVASAEQLINGAHTSNGSVQRFDIAVDVGEDA